MIRLLLLLLAVAVLAIGFAWVADNPGALTLNWIGYEINTSVFFAIVVLVALAVFAFLLWVLLRSMISTPAVIAQYFKKRRQVRGLEALSSGLIAVGSGDRALASKYSELARKSLPNEPLTALLRAQTAQLMGNRATARRIYEGMLGAPDTAVLGLRGLFLEAEQEREFEAAYQFAERAMRLDPKLSWAVTALFEFQCKNSNWEEALRTLEIGRQQGHFNRRESLRRRAVLLTAQAKEAEEGNIDKALELASEAHKLAPELVPAAEIYGRLLASKGNTHRAAKIVAKTWRLSPHPDLAQVYAFARPGDSPRDRLKRVQSLASTTPHNREGQIAIAAAAVEARDWDEARTALKPLIDNHPSARICILMARVEGGQHGDKGRVREWLARALKAPRDPVWTVDGYVSDRWQPVSPISGVLDAFDWKVPVEALERDRKEVVVEDFVPLEFAGSGTLADPSEGAPSEVTVAPGVEADTQAAEILPVVVTDEGESDKADKGQTEPVIVTASSKDKDVVYQEEADARKLDGLEPVAEPLQAEQKESESVMAAEQKTRETDGGKKDTKAHKAEAKDEPASSESKKAAKSTTKSKEKRSRTPSKPRIFVPPRAPDDPGPEPMDPDEALTPLARFRSPVAKTD